MQMTDGYISPVRVLTALVTSAVGWEQASRGKRSIVPMASWCAALVAGIPDEDLDAAMLMVAHDTSKISAVRDRLIAYGLSLSESERWGKRGISMVPKMALVATLEATYPKMLQTSSSRAYLCGLSDASWSRVWGRRYEMLYRRIESWRSAAMEEIKQRQKD
jgi:hypothetical protein